MPDDRQIDGMDMRDFLLGDAEESGRDTDLCLQGNRLQAVKWHQWKVEPVPAGRVLSTWTPYNMPHLHNLEWDPREEHPVDFPHAWVMHPVAAAADAFLMTLAIEPPIKGALRTPTRHPNPASSPPGTHPARAITQYVTSLVRDVEEATPPHPGFEGHPG